ncbi:hypothetical protein Taro_024443 [Colocasia esculenta]|uniref:Cytochrome P450 94A1 n=1 Tax=Colocasia esculenta TaxID=4460 RepID=A0A843VDP3_COLES|nr:hypothetical protein [Colocasia esculenta]
METTALHSLLPFPTLILTCTTFVVVVVVVFKATAADKKRHVDGRSDSGYPVIGNVVGLLRNRHRFLDWASDMLSASPTSTIRVHSFLNLTPPGVCTADPTNIDHLLRANFANYVKGRRQAAALSDLLGRGIFVADGAAWLLQRKIASREFTTRSLRSFVVDVVGAEIRNRLLPFLSAAADRGDVVDLQDVLSRFGFDNICNLAFGTDPACLDLGGRPAPSFVAAFDEAVQISYRRLLSPVPAIWKLKRALNLGSERRLREAIRVIDDYAAGIISSRRCHPGGVGQPQDLLSRFAACLEEDAELRRSVGAEGCGEERFLRDIVVSFVLAGKDSTSAALTWFFWLLSENPFCERRILSEIRKAFEPEAEGGRGGYEGLKQLHYLHAAVTEAMRLYPPVPINSRVAAGKDVLPDGTRVAAGWFADYSAYAMGRSERVWGKGCGEYRPERWLNGEGEFAGEAEAARFPVFHAGPRMCLGREMAYLQMKAVAASVLDRFVVEPVRKAGPPACELSVTLKMKGGFPVRVKRR